jgi:hypothetical protein
LSECPVKRSAGRRIHLCGWHFMRHIRSPLQLASQGLSFLGGRGGTGTASLALQGPL